MDHQVCGRCGAWSDEPDVPAEEAVVVCGRCGERRPFLRLPLFAVTGPSGAGKSAVCARLAGRLRGTAVVLEQDLLWVDGLTDPGPDGGHSAFRTTWLRVAAAIGQSTGQPVVLCGTVVPASFELRPQRALFAEIRYLALVCDDADLAARLAARPAWRGSRDQIGDMLAFNRWLKRNAATTSPPMTLADTTAGGVEATAELVLTWVLDGIAGYRRLRPS